MVPDPLKAYLQDHRDEHLDKLKELLRFPSIANVPGDANACGPCAEWLVTHLKGLGFDARMAPTDGKPAVLGTLHETPGAPTVLLYGHYDVQPPDPLELWVSDPFEPEVRDEKLYARGASDDKGRIFAQMMAIEAWVRAGGGLPVNLTVLFEGEEEIGSPNLEPFLAAHAADLASNSAIVADSGFFAPGVPSIIYALRGLVYLELTVTGPSSDLHSGSHGGAVANPLNVLARLIAKLHDDQGRVTLDGFYDNVLPLSEAERREWEALGFDEAQYAASLGLSALTGGEAGVDVMERRWARPTLECHGIMGGYTDEGSKTVIPSKATAKLSMRLVAAQEPDRVTESLRAFVAENAPAGVTTEIRVHAGARPVQMDPDAPAMKAGLEAQEEGFGLPARMIRNGASVPIVEVFQRVLGVEPVVLGMGLPDDNTHAPNEKLDLDHLWKGSVVAAALFQRLSGVK
jgi:acetylornithine deacetylase/succinyl-diaminopimelate desuccinylase-like protein